MPSVMSGGLVRQVVVVAIALAAAACGGDDDDAAELTTASAAVSAPAAAITTPAEGDVVVPADFPIDQVAEPATSSLRSASGAAPGPWVLIYAVDGDLESAVTAYRDALTDDGFTLDDATEVGGLVSSFVVTGSGFRVAVVGSPAAGGASAGMLVSVERTAE